MRCKRMPSYHDQQSVSINYVHKQGGKRGSPYLILCSKLFSEGGLRGEGFKNPQRSLWMSPKHPPIVCKMGFFAQVSTFTSKIVHLEKSSY